jgi:hypothetical protein
MRPKKDLGGGIRWEGRRGGKERRKRGGEGGGKERPFIIVIPFTVLHTKFFS